MILISLSRDSQNLSKCWHKIWDVSIDLSIHNFLPDNKPYHYHHWCSKYVIDNEIDIYTVYNFKTVSRIKNRSRRGQKPCLLHRDVWGCFHKKIYFLQAPYLISFHWHVRPYLYCFNWCQSVQTIVIFVFLIHFPKWRVRVNIYWLCLIFKLNRPKNSGHFRIAICTISS